MRHTRRLQRQRWINRIRLRRPRDMRRVLIHAGLVTAGVFLVIQLVFPFFNKALPWESVEGVNYGLADKSWMQSDLDARYQRSHVAILLGPKSDKVYASPTIRDLGMRTSSDKQLAALDYPLWLRIIPTSILWGHLVANPPAVDVQSRDAVGKYVDRKLMATCREQPTNATLEVKKETLVVKPDDPGGKCERNEVVRELSRVTPHLDATPQVRTPLTEIPAKFTTQKADAYLRTLSARIGDNVPLVVKDSLLQIERKQFITWLDFASTDEGITTTVSADKSNAFLAEHVAPKVAAQPGVSRVTTRDFTEISRVDGAPGAELDTPATADSMSKFLATELDKPVATTRPIPARVEFTRTYSSTDAGLNALLENYAKDHKGAWGIAYAEIGGQGRRANYNGDKQFVTASTYKLFVAYSVLRRVEAGTFNWASEASCFNKMISHSDNACAEGFQTKIGGGNISAGAKPLTDEAKALGLNNTTFMKSGGPYTTANDLVTFLGSLEAGQSLRGESRSRLISAMLANVYRSGVPAGASGQVADKVGFMNALLHDAAIVYSPKGTYVIAVMTDGSSWAEIAGLTKQIEGIRAN